MAKRRSFGEFDGIDVLRGYLESTRSELVSIGIGDDAAVLRRPKGQLVVSVDASLEGTHFDLSWLSLQQAAERSFHAAASDLAAMGADPLAAVCALEAPNSADRGAFAAIGKGQARAARDLSCPLVGGNVTRAQCFGFTTTVLGTVGKKPRLRSGAKPGDEVWLSHEAGWAGLGLGLFQQRLVTRVNGRLKYAVGLGRWTTRAVKAFTSPRAKLEVSQDWRTRVNSLIDTSDSLASELRHLATASKQRIIVDVEQLLATHRTVVRAALEMGLDPLSVVLSGGEDYALLGTGPAKMRPVDAIVLGRVEAGRGAVLSSGGKHQPLVGGFEHLRT